MTKTQLLDCLKKLTEVVSAWNESPDPEDRGPGNDPLVLILWDDGSGKIGICYGPFDELHTRIQHEFHSLDELVEYLDLWVLLQ